MWSFEAMGVATLSVLGLKTYGHLLNVCLYIPEETSTAGQ